MSEDSNFDEGLGCGCIIIAVAIGAVIISEGGTLISSIASLLDRLAQ